MSIKNRLAQLEKQRPPEVHKYVCVYYDCIDDNPHGYKVTHFEQAGKSESFTLATLAELDAFEARPDVDLLRVVICYVSDAIPQDETHKELQDISGR